MALLTVWISPKAELIVVTPFGMYCTDKCPKTKDPINGKYDLSYNHRYWPKYKAFLRSRGYEELGKL